MISTGRCPPTRPITSGRSGALRSSRPTCKTATGVFGPSYTIIALPGDVVGASPPESGLFLDEPTLLFFNEFANACCTGGNDPRTPGATWSRPRATTSSTGGPRNSCGRCTGGTGTPRSPTLPTRTPVPGRPIPVRTWSGVKTAPRSFPRISSGILAVFP